jgi:hypothetical protein
MLRRVVGGGNILDIPQSLGFRGKRNTKDQNEYCQGAQHNHTGLFKKTMVSEISETGTLHGKTGGYWFKISQSGAESREIPPPVTVNALFPFHFPLKFLN